MGNIEQNEYKKQLSPRRQEIVNKAKQTKLTKRIEKENNKARLQRARESKIIKLKELNNMELEDKRSNEMRTHNKQTEMKTRLSILNNFFGDTDPIHNEFKKLNEERKKYNLRSAFIDINGDTN